MIKKIFCVFFSVLLAAGSVLPAAAFTPTEFEVTAKSAVLLSYDTGDVIYSKDPDARTYPASITKMMTALVLCENVKNLDETAFTASYETVHSLDGTDSSVYGIQEGETFTARSLLYMLMLCSANDAAMLIAQGVSGGERPFVELMNAKAAELGMTNTHFCNPHGLHEYNHYTTVNDIIKMLRAAIGDKEVYAAMSADRYDLPATNMSEAQYITARNYLINRMTYAYYNRAVCGKTGFTDEAGYCLAAMASADGYSYLGVVMGCADDETRYTELTNLFKWVFSDFDYKVLVNEGEIVSEIPVELSLSTDHVGLVPAESFSAYIPAGADASTVKLDITLDKESLDAPVEKGAEVGTADIMFGGEKLGEIRLVTADAVESSGWLVFWRFVTDTVKSKAFAVVVAVIVGAIVIFVLICLVLNRRSRKKRGVKRYKRL